MRAAAAHARPAPHQHAQAYLQLLDAIAAPDAPAELAAERKAVAAAIRALMKEDAVADPAPLEQVPAPHPALGAESRCGRRAARSAHMQPSGNASHCSQEQVTGVAMPPRSPA